tara:strand:- start:147 stop:425 length:279 start_codon:yes stop_codon:yes gene_type:complete
MSSTENEITLLKQRLNELEKKKEEDEEYKKINSLDYNFNVLENIIIDKKKSISMNQYRKSVSISTSIDQKIVIHLESIYNILKILAKKLEEN